MPLSPQEYETRRIAAGYFQLRRGRAGVSNIYDLNNPSPESPVTHPSQGVASLNGVIVDALQRCIILDEAVESMSLLEMHRNCQDIFDEISMLEYQSATDRLTDNIFQLKNGYRITEQSIPKLYGGSLHDEQRGDIYTSFRILGNLENVSDHIGTGTSRLVLGAINNDNRELLAYGQNVVNNVEFFIKTVHNNEAIQEMVFRLRGQFTEGDYILPSEFAIRKPDNHSEGFWYGRHVVALHPQQDLVLSSEVEEEIAEEDFTVEVTELARQRLEEERERERIKPIDISTIKRKMDI